MRWEGIDTRSAGDTYDEVNQRTSVWSPLLQTLWKLPDTKGDQVRLALTRTYKAQPTASLIPRRNTSTNNSQTDPDREGNPYLKPELALGIDASYEHYWAEGALLSARASARRIDGYTRQGLLFINDRWVSTPVNDGRAEYADIGTGGEVPAARRDGRARAGHRLARQRQPQLVAGGAGAGAEQPARPANPRQRQLRSRLQDARTAC